MAQEKAEPNDFKRTQKNNRFLNWFNRKMDNEVEKTGIPGTQILMDSVCKVKKWKAPKVQK